MEYPQVPVALMIISIAISFLLAIAYTLATFKFLKGVVGISLFNLYAVFGSVYWTWFVWRCYAIVHETGVSTEVVIMNNIVFPTLTGGGFVWGLLWLNNVTLTMAKQTSFLDSAKQECDNKTQSLLGRLEEITKVDK